MDGNGRTNLRNWGFLEQQANSLKSHLGLQLMSSVVEKPIYGGGSVQDNPYNPLQFSVMPSTNGGPFHHHRVGGVPETHIPMDYWMNHNRDKYLNSLPGNHHNGYYQPSYGVLPESSVAMTHPIQLPLQMNIPKNEDSIPQMEETCEGMDNGIGIGIGVDVVKKRGGEKAPKSPPKEKKPRTRVPRAPKDESTPVVHRARAPKKRAEVVINGINMDISDIPIPICSCTGNPHQCYRWGSGGWQSACCTMGLSMYPLPMSTKRRGSRIAGRKMSIGAFKKVLEKLASEGYDFSDPIDLRNYWARHGTNKFVTIR
ncbi:protein BASIC PENTACYSTEINE2-like [Primulina tabacum]|uniref:protein BASIC PENTACYSTEINE2-like n=1 Tax=Primulina tabacum TaxID=48773 RepID=UPI003F59832C